MTNRPVKWGIISTADINRKVIPGAHASNEGRPRRRREPRPGARRRVREAVGDPARLRLLRGPARRSRDRGGLHLAAEHDALRLVDPRARGRQARALREAALAPPGRGRRRLRHGRPHRACTSARRSCTATTRRRSACRQLVAEGAIGELRLVRSVFSYSLYDHDNIRLRTEVEGGALMDVGCYNVSGSRLLGGEPERAFGEAWFGPSGTDWVFAGTLRFPDDVLATFHCGTALPNQDELEAIGSEGSLFLDDPWHCNYAGDRAPPRRRASSASTIEHEDSYRLELENLSDAIRGEGELLLGARRRAWGRRARSRRCTSPRRAAAPSRCDGRRGTRAGGGCSRSGIVLDRRRARGDRGGRLRPRPARGDRPAGRRLREHGARVREGARALPAPDCPEHRHPPVGATRQGGDVPLPHGTSSCTSRARRSCSPGRAVDDPADTLHWFQAGREARSSRSSRRGAATRPTCSAIRGSFDSRERAARRPRRAGR